MLLVRVLDPIHYIFFKSFSTVLSYFYNPNRNSIGSRMFSTIVAPSPTPGAYWTWTFILLPALTLSAQARSHSNPHTGLDKPHSSLISPPLTSPSFSHPLASRCLSIVNQLTQKLDLNELEIQVTASDSLWRHRGQCKGSRVVK